LVVHVDNCSVHRSAVTESFVKTRDTVSMPLPPYSLTIASSDFAYFPRSKKDVNIPVSLTKISYMKSSTQF
jgi:hypothetical protein